MRKKKKNKICYIFSKLINLQWELTFPTDAEFTRGAVWGAFSWNAETLWVKTLTRRHENKQLNVLQILLQKAAFVQQTSKTTWRSWSDVISLSHPFPFFLLQSEWYCEESITGAYSLFTPMCVWKVISLVTQIAVISLLSIPCGNHF